MLEGDAVQECCSRVFLSARGAIEENQGGLLGIYNYTGIHNKRPYYAKKFLNDTYYLFYNIGGPAAAGWRVSTDLEANYLYVTTRQTAAEAACPDGVAGGYDRDRDADFDDSFSVECHSEIVEVPCCLSLSVNATSGSVAENQPAVLFDYDQVGSLNGRPLYHGNQFGLDFYVYFRKTGRSSDGWTIAMEPGSDLFSVTSRNTADCPDEVKVGYDRNKFEDDSFRIKCSDAGALEYDDGGGDEVDGGTEGPQFLDPLGLMDRATKAVMDYDEAIALNGGRNEKREQPPYPADEKEAAPATTSSPTSSSGRPTFVDDAASGAIILGPGRFFIYSVSFLSCSLAALLF